MPWPDADQPSLSRPEMTRWLCISVYGGWIVLLGVALSLAIVPNFTTLDSGTLFAAALPYGLLLYAWWFVGRMILRWWRKCDQCRKKLFSEPGWIGKDQPHYMAKKIWGSYFNSTAWQYATKGTAHCMWCGHKDGETPRYVAKS